MQALFQNKEYEEADSLLQKVHKMFPENATVLVLRGKNTLLKNSLSFSLQPISVSRPNLNFS